MLVCNGTALRVKKVQLLFSLAVYNLCSLYIPITAPDRSPVEFINISVSRTERNQGLVIHWNSIILPPPGTIFSFLEIQYRTIGKWEEVTEEVGARQSRVYFNHLENAHNFEVAPIISDVI